MGVTRIEAGVIAAENLARNMRRPLRILLVDADYLYRTTLSAKLVEEGHIVSSLSNCHDAWLLAQQVTFDLTLIDLEVPAMTSMELVRRIRKQDEKARIIATSPNMTQRSVRVNHLCEANGIVKVFGKDSGFNTLYRHLSGALRA